MKKQKLLLITTLSIFGIAAVQAQTANVVTGAGYIDLFNGSLTSPSLQSGNRFLWWPDRAAFRVGSFTGYYALVASDIGQGSIAAGTNSHASGIDSVALGNGAAVTGTNGIAIGRSISTGAYAIALRGSASGADSIALGGYAWGYHSVAIGMSYAIGDESISMGSGQANGYSSIAGGLSTVTSMYGTAFGQYNLNMRKDYSAPNPIVLSLLDPIFEIGNGDEGSGDAGPDYHNALTVFRDGTVRIDGSLEVYNDISVTGTIRVKTPKGGISMGQFN